MLKRTTELGSGCQPRRFVGEGLRGRRPLRAYSLYVALAVLLCSLLSPVSALGTEADWICLDCMSLEETAPVLTLLESTAGGLVLSVSVPGFFSETIDVLGTEFSRISLPSCARASADTGRPELPPIRRLIAVPDGCQLSVSVAAQETVAFRDVVVYPVPRTVADQTEEGHWFVAEEFAYDQQAYASQLRVPQPLVEVRHVGALRGQAVAQLVIHPFRYKADSEDLDVLRELIVDVEFTGGFGGVSGDLGPLDSIAESALLNYTGMGVRRGSRAQADPGVFSRCYSLNECTSPSLNPDYLMIVYGPLWNSSWVDSLGEHRARWNGYNVAAVSDTTVWESFGGQSISSAAIDSFVSRVYRGATAEHMTDGKLGYVLLVGDARGDAPDSHIPACELPGYGVSGEAVTTDYTYSCVDGDYLGDVLIGRACVDSLHELEYEFSRFIEYETTAQSGAATWRDSVLLSCGFAWRGCIEADSIRARTVDHGFELTLPTLEDYGYEVDQVHAHELPGVACGAQQDAARMRTIQRINKGRHVVLLTSHGAMHEVQHFTWQNADTLRNERKWPFWISVACQSCAFDSVWAAANPPDYPSECLGERLLHRGRGHFDGGAVAYVGPSENSVEHKVTFLARYMLEGLTDGHHHEAGQILAYGKLMDYSVTGDKTVIHSYHLLGDPALNVALTDHDGYGAAHDLAISEDDVSVVPWSASLGDTIEITAVIRNQSNCTPDTSVQWHIEVCELDGTGCIGIASGAVQTAAWDTSAIAAQWVIPNDFDEVGGRLMTVRIDTSGPQLFTDNNVAGVPVSVLFNAPGFPFETRGIRTYSPRLVDVDGDGETEAVVSSSLGNMVAAVSAAGTVEWSDTTQSYGGVFGAPAIADIDADGAMEVLVTSGTRLLCLSGALGSSEWATPFSHQTLGGYTRFTSVPVVADIVGDDGCMEVALSGEAPGFLGGYYTFVIDSDGTDDLWTESDTSERKGQYSWFGSAVTDLDRDGTPDVLTAHTQAQFGSRLVARSGADGDVLWMASLGSQGSTTACAAVVADVDTTSRGTETIVGRGQVCCLSDSGTLRWECPVLGTCSGLAIAELDSAHAHPPEIVALTCAGGADSVLIEETAGWLCVLSGSGALIDSVGMSGRGRGEPAIADLDDDGNMEIVVATSRIPESVGEPEWVTELRVFTFSSGHLAMSDLVNGRPLLFGGEAEDGPVIGDIDEDDKLEIWFGDGTGLVHCLEFEPGGALSRWPGHRHDCRNTGVYEHVMTGAYPESTCISWWGDYLLSGDVLVDTNSVLHVQPGTTVRAAPYQDDAPEQTDGLVGIIFNPGSALVAHGEPTDSIRFRALGPSIEAGRWRGITLRSGARKADLMRCRVSLAQNGLWNSGADTVHVQKCWFRKNEIKGIRCDGSAGASSVLLRRNRIEFSQIGIELTACAAVVDSNEIYGGTSYGMRILQDEGSTVRANEINHAKTSPFSGIYSQGAGDSLWILDNTLADIRTYGIHYEQPQGSDGGLIRGNDITCSLTAAKGMYFYDASPKVRWNSISNAHVGVFIWDDGGIPPDLGDTTVSDGNNSVSLVTRQPGAYYVRLLGDVQGDIPAENNYWQPVSGDSADPSKFSFQVDWHPWLAKDPHDRWGEPSEPDASGQPLSFGLRQNHPNPFNPTTRLSFSVRAEAHTTLRVYNVQGQLVRELVRGTLETGRYEAFWDGKDRSGNRVSSGVYFCRLVCGEERAQIRLVLLK